MIDIAARGVLRSRFRGGRIAVFAACLALTAAGPEPAVAQPAEAARAIATENASITTRLRETELALEGAHKELARLQATRDDLDASMDRIDKYANLPGVGRVFVETVVERLRALPRPEALTTRVEQRQLLVSTSDALLVTEQGLRNLADIDAAAARRLAGAGASRPESYHADEEAAVRRLLTEQRDLLTRLTAEQQKLLDALTAISEGEDKLAARSEQARVELSRLLFWVPVRPGWAVVTELGGAVAWTFSPANWSAAAVAAGTAFARSPLWPTLWLLAAVVLFAVRTWLWRQIAALAPSAVGYERYGPRHALTALAITAALALPLPIVMRVLAVLLSTAPEAVGFVRSLGDVMWRVGPLVLALVGTAALLDRRGIGVHHFGWDEESLAGVARAVRRFTAAFVPLVAIAALNGLDHAPFVNRESLGRLANLVAMLVLAGFLARLLRKKGTLMQRLVARAPRSWAVRLHPLWFAAVMAVPLGIAALSTAGYFVAAVYFFGRAAFSLYVVFGAVMLYGLIALWVDVERWRLARRDEAQAQQRTTPLPGGRPVADIAAIGEQTRALLDLGVTLLVLAALWGVWKDALPALAEIGDYALWTYEETAGGKSVTRSITAGHLFLAMLVGAVTAVVVRNIGALVDMVLLQHLDVQADATYALKVTTRYAIAAAGIVLAANILGMDWSDVQWLVAALGVGLGFGLQEIFGNFVAGIIVLVERPVRIGDVITIGDVSGTVTRIRARVITVVDFDNKEVLIPNKSLITDRVVNWTLSSQTTRIVVRVNVAADTDLERAQRVILAAVRRNADLSQEHPPRVYFVSFGANALTLEISAFVDSFAKRQRVQHEINVAVDRALRDNGIRVA